MNSLDRFMGAGHNETNMIIVTIMYEIIHFSLDMASQISNIDT